MLQSNRDKKEQIVKYLHNRTIPFDISIYVFRNASPLKDKILWIQYNKD